jgi:hypothetical protein
VLLCLTQNIRLTPFKLTFVASKPPPPRIAYQEVLMTAEAGSESI